MQKTLRLTVCLQARLFENRLLCLFDNGTLKAGIVDQRATARWIAILQEEKAIQNDNYCDKQVIKCS
jgi:hypothetical protein